MRAVSLRTVMFITLCAMCGDGHAATVTANSRMVLSTTLDSTCTNNATRACNQVSDVPLLSTSPSDVATEIDEKRAYFAPGNVSSVANFLFETDARTSARLGTLKAYAAVGIASNVGADGIPSAGGGPVPGGITAISEVRINDQLRITSSTLAIGTPISVHTLFDVEGEGRGALSLAIRGRRGAVPLALVFNGTDIASGFGDDLQDISGDFTAFVGETLSIEYALNARATSSTAAWDGTPRSAVSSYGNSAFLYFDLVDPGIDAEIIGSSGFNYLLPRPVPLPPAGALIALALIGLVRRSGQIRKG